MSELNIFQRIQAVMNDVKGVAKDAENKHGGYKYAGHEAVTAALRDAYCAQGIVRSASVIEVQRTGGDLRLVVDVSWINVDRPEDRHTVRVVGESGKLTKGDGASPQQAGIALSYAVKNAEFKVFALTGDDTPDGDAAQHGDALYEILIGRYEAAETREEIDGVNADVRANWARVAAHRAPLTQARDAAFARIGGAS